MEKSIAEQIKENIAERNSKMIKSLQAEMECSHKWERHGFGFKCCLCDRYTGLNSELNKLIAQTKPKDQRFQEWR